MLLLGGEPGIGKSTLVLQLAGALATTAADGDAPATVLYASAEESPSQLHLRAERLGLTGGPADGALSVLAGTDVAAIITAASAEPPALLVVDSIQTVEVDGLDGPPGSVGQVRESAVQLGAFARERGVPVLLVGHVTKDGAIAGPKLVVADPGRALTDWARWHRRQIDPLVIGASVWMMSGIEYTGPVTKPSLAGRVRPRALTIPVVGAPTELEAGDLDLDGDWDLVAQAPYESRCRRIVQVHARLGRVVGARHVRVGKIWLSRIFCSL